MKLFLSSLIGIFLILVFSQSCSQATEKSSKTLTQDRIPESEVRKLIEKLYEIEWQGAYPITSPLTWSFGFTNPMAEILAIGKPAQNELLTEVSNPKIKDQIIILLGGVGDEKAVEPIINAMIEESEISENSNAGKINLAANIALTNITVAPVIWHHGGGIVETAPPANSKKLWEVWWQENKTTFSVEGITQSRNYSNYPNYGIYRDKK